MLSGLDTSTQLAIFVGLLFIVIGSQQVYTIVDKLFRPLKVNIADDYTGQPTKTGLVIHGVVMALLTYLYASSM